MNDNELQIGALYEYIGPYKVTIWPEKQNPNPFVSDLNHLENGDLFALLNYDKKPEDPHFLVCKGLFVKTGLMGGFICYRSEIRLKEE